MHDLGLGVDAAPVLIAKIAPPEFGRVDPRLGRKHPREQAVAAHLQRKNADPLARLAHGVAPELQRQGGFAVARPAAEDSHLARHDRGDQIVDARKRRRHATAAALLQR